MHEAYLKLFQSAGLTYENRRQFYAYAAQVMRHMLVDYARRKYSQKRGSGLRVEMPDDFALPAQQVDDILALDQALERLSLLDARQGRILEMHYFGEMSIDEIADYFSLSSRTIKRDLQSGRLFLKCQLLSAV